MPQLMALAIVGFSSAYPPTATVLGSATVTGSLKYGCLQIIKLEKWFSKEGGIVSQGTFDNV